MTNTLTKRRPWPDKTLSDYWGPHYRLALRSVETPALLIITETGFVLASSETDAVGLSFTAAEPRDQLLEVGMARSDLPKELQSSWKLQWASFATNAPWLTSEPNPESFQYWHNWLEEYSQRRNITAGKVDAIIFGSFVRPTKESHPWVEVMKGKIRQIRSDQDGWIDLLIENPSAENDLKCGRPASYVTEPKDLKLTLVMLATLAVWVVKFLQFLKNHDPRATTAQSDYAFFNLLHKAMEADWAGHSAVAALIIIHHLRMAVGVEFAGRDSSFFRAKLHAPSAARTDLEWAESSFLAVIVSCSVLLTYFVGSPDYVWSTLLLFIQAIFVILYDWVFWDALLKYDEGRRANKFVLFGDSVFLITTSLILLNRILRGTSGTSGPAFGTDTGAVVIILCWLYSGVFIYEVFSAYRSSLRSTLREIIVAFGHLKNPALWRRQRRDSSPSGA